MSETRKITVEKDNPIWQEYDREVRVELWHNQHQVTALRLSHEEAWNLRYALARFLETTPAPREEA